jgi:Ca-activated chloride channel family protein
LYAAAQDLEHLRLGDETHMAEGLAMGFNELQRRGSRRYISRVVLLTDGHTLKVKECYEWADRCRQQGYQLTTMGIGVEFNEDLLIPLADMTGGKAYYIETPEQIPAAFLEELGAVQRISYRNVEVKLQLTRGVELRKAYRVLPEMTNFEPGPEMDGSYALLLGDYDPGAPAALLLELVLPAWDEGIYRLAQAMLAWDDPAELQERQNVRQDVVIQMARMSTARMDDRVMNIVERVGAYKMGQQAMEAAQAAAASADADGRGQATLRLRQAATRLLDMGEADLAKTMMLQAQALELSGNLDPEATKRFRYETRRLAQSP